MIRDAESSALNSSLGAPFALVKKFRNNRLKSSFIPNFFTNTKLPPQNTRICDLDSATRRQIVESTTFCHSKSFSCHSERSEESKKNPFVILRKSEIFQKKNNRDSSVALLPQNDNVGLDSANPQNLQGELPRRFCESARNDEFLDSSLRLRFAQNDNVGAWNYGFIRDSSPTAQNNKIKAENDNVGLDSAILQNQFFPAKKSLRFAESRGKFLPNTALIALGANLKNPIATFKSLFTKLARNAKIHILSTSPIYKNPPFGYANQPFFYNATILLATKMCLLEFYAFIFYLERIFGRNRKRAFKNAPRTLDIDIIFFNDIFMRSKKLNIPHPSWQTRPSVLVPLIFQVHYKGF